MFRFVALVALVAASAYADDDLSAFHSAINEQLKSFDPAFVKQVHEIATNLDISRNEKINQINTAIAALPADQQEKAQKFRDIGLSKEKDLIALAKQIIPDFSAETQTVLNNIVSIYENGADTPCRQVFDQIKTAFTGASDAVKTELKNARSGLTEKLKDFAKTALSATQ